MPEYIIRRTSEWDREISPCEGAIKKKRPQWDIRTFKTPEEHDKRLSDNPPWLSVGTEHCILKNPRGIARRLEDQTVWVVEADSIEELYNRYGTLVISNQWSLHPDKSEICVEIYDDYRE